MGEANTPSLNLDIPLLELDTWLAGLSWEGGSLPSPTTAFDITWSVDTGKLQSLKGPTFCLLNGILIYAECILGCVCHCLFGLSMWRLAQEIQQSIVHLGETWRTHQISHETRDSLMVPHGSREFYLKLADVHGGPVDQGTLNAYKRVPACTKGQCA